MSIPIIIGSYREGRMGERVGKFIYNRMQSRNLDVCIVDPKELELGILQRRYPDYPTHEAPESLGVVAEIFSQAPAFVLVTAEYNYSIPPGLSNILDHFKGEFYRKPTAIVSYSMGPFGGVRSTEQLRGLMACLGSVALPQALPIPSVHENIDDAGNPLKQEMEDFVSSFLDETEWYLKMFSQAKA